jgi:hypothetical protein
MQCAPEVLSGDLSRIGCVAVNADEPALFDLPAAEQPATSQPRQRGRNRETWARTVTAEITVLDPAALRETARRVQEEAVTVTLPGLPHGEEAVAEPAVNDVDHPLYALTWLLWPSVAMQAPLEAGAFRVLSEDIDVEPEPDDRGTLAWTVTVKLTDVRTLRRLAAQAHPDEAASIADSLAAAWQHAADPFAPLHAIPAIAWRPGSVTVQHVPAKTRPGTGLRA